MLSTWSTSQESFLQQKNVILRTVSFTRCGLPTRGMLYRSVRVQSSSSILTDYIRPAYLVVLP